MVAALCAAPRSALADTPRRVLHDTTVVTDGELFRRTQATALVTVTGATGLKESAPVAGAEVELSIAPATDESSSSEVVTGAWVAPARSARRLARARTGPDGSAVLRFAVPAIEPGPYRLSVRTRSPHGASTTERPVLVSDQVHLHLRTDRPVYRPGQTIQWRVTALSAADAHPAAGDQVEVVVRDPRDTAIWRGRQSVPASGMIGGSIPLAEDLLTGSYALTARVRGVEQTERVSVREFRLPAFELRIERPGADTAVEPGSRVRARVAARYRYGEAVQGEVKLELETDRRDVDRRDAAVQSMRDRDTGDRSAAGRLDRDGGFSADLRVPHGAERAILLRASVVDGAGRRESATLSLPLRGDDDLRVALVPERRDLSRGALHWFTALTTDGRGRLVPARLELRAGGRRLSLASPGARRISLRAPDAPTWKIRISAIAPGGDVDEQSMAIQLGREPILRLREAVVAAGDRVVVTGSWPDARGPLLATLLRENAPIAAALARVDRGGLRAELVPPPGAFGLMTVRLVELGWQPGSAGARETQQLNAYLRPAELAVSIAGRTRHRPGARASLDVSVRDAAGRPVPGAALAASVVDERVLALDTPRPDLVEALRRADLVEDATALGIAFADLLRSSPATRSRDAVALRAILEALPPPHRRPDIVVPAEERWQRESERIGRAQAPALDRLVQEPGAIGRRGPDGRWQYSRELWQLLAQAGWSAAERTTPWSRPITWAYALEVEPALRFELMAPQVAGARLDDLARELDHKRGVARRLLLRRGSDGLRDLAARGAIARNLAVDPWGTAIRVERAGGWLHPIQSRTTVDLVSAGPDLAFGTGDDHRIEDVFRPGGAGSIGTIGYGSGSGTAHGGTLGGVPEVRIGSAPEAPVRRRFDETVLWRVGLLTGAAGGARLDVPLGDSITGWKVAVEALSRGGAVGAAETRLETFQPLHLDAELPPRLAAGDRYRIPIAVANHSGRPQRLVVEAELGGALRRRGPGSRALELAAGATGVVHVDAEARGAGAGSVRLALMESGRAVDRVERSIPVDPPGELVRALHTGDVRDGGGRLRFELPRDAAAMRGTL
ncbi:MAG TPA: MG2 domain-containing protein, partial [Kofleriaceae bacterium]|nr:MG2 domain-containing protein [Kofleriaceae bacterium]